MNTCVPDGAELNYIVTCLYNRENISTFMSRQLQGNTTSLQNIPKSQVWNLLGDMGNYSVFFVYKWSARLHIPLKGQTCNFHSGATSSGMALTEVRLPHTMCKTYNISTYMLTHMPFHITQIQPHWGESINRNTISSMNNTTLFQ